MSINPLYSSMNRDIRFGGLASGLNTEEIVNKLISLDKMKLNDLYGKKQIFQWQQESYRNIINTMNDFRNKYFNVLNRETNILSFANSKRVNNDFKNHADIFANADAINGKYIINEISQIASSTKVTSSSRVIQSIEGFRNISNMPLDFTGKSFNASLDGVNRTISFDRSYSNEIEFMEDLRAKLNQAFGNNRVEAILTEDKKVAFKADNSILLLTSGENDLLMQLGIYGNSYNHTDINKSPAEIFGENQDLIFKINGVEFNFSKDTRISTVINTINSSQAKVNMSYSSISDSFTITTKDTGESSYLKIDNITGNFFGESSYVNITESEIRNGTDAIFYLNDPGKSKPVIRSSNVFTIDGVTFSLKSPSNQPIEYTVENNSEGMYEKISSFINDYNKLIELIEGKISEKKYQDYRPLTDEEKMNMSEKQIELWEEKAKSGLLKSDSILSGMLYNLRTAFFTPVKGEEAGFYNIGITVSKDYSKYKLEIDEEKLKKAIAEEPGQVINLFGRQEDTRYSPTMSKEERELRYSVSGFAVRISDIFMDHIRTSRDNMDMKGILIERAGLSGDSSQYSNFLNRQMDGVDKSIRRAVEWLRRREQSYWQKFTSMEAALQRLNSQSDWLSSQFMK